MTPAARLREVIDTLINRGIVKSDADFANIVGRNHTYLSRVLNEKVPYSAKFSKSIVDCFPNVNGNWILTGEGDMVISGDVNIENRVNSHNVEVRASGNSNVSINNRGSAETQSLRAKLEILERQNAELQRLLEEEKERSQKYWQMIEKLTNN